MNKNTADIKARIDAFKKKHYLSLVLKGVLITLGLIFSVYFIINTLEYSFRFGSLVRAMLLFIFVGSAVYGLIKHVFKPLYQLLYHSMDDEEAAKRIGDFFPEVSDKLLNIIQLQQYHTKSDASLQNASISQKAQAVSAFPFAGAVDLRENFKYLKYLLIPLLVIVAVLLFSPSLFTSSTERIVKFNQEFVPQAPFQFNIENEALLAFKNEDFTINLNLSGEAIPQNAYLLEGDRKIKMRRENGDVFSFTFKKIQDSKTIQFEAAGFNSKPSKVNVVSRPDLKNFNVYLNFPAYLKKKSETLSNVGNLQIPEGTHVKWQLKTLASDEVAIKFSKNSTSNILQPSDNQLFDFEKQFINSDSYSILLKNQYSNNKEKILYKIDVIPDEYPQINLNVYQDTTLYSYVALGGNVTDDHGIRNLKLRYQLIKNNNEGAVHSVDIPIARDQTSQRYYYQWSVDSLNIAEGNAVKYWLEVSDNDGVNGSKKTKTGAYTFKIPSKRDIEKSINSKTDRTENNIDNRLQEAKELKDQIQQAENKLKGKKELNWQDQNLLKDIVKKREELNKALEELKKQNQELNTKRDRFNKTDEKIAEKAEQLQKLMDDLLDDETKKLYDELKKLLEEQKDIDQIQDVLNQMNKKENNLEKELERTLELFKRMKFDRALDETIEELKEQVQDQDRLIKETDNKPGEEEEMADKENPEAKDQKFDEKKTKSESSKDLAEKQKQLKEEFEHLEEKLEDVKQQNQELKNPKSLPDTKEEQESVKQKQQESQENLQNNRRKKSRQSQQQAKENMQKMVEKLQQMQSSMQMTMMQQNLDDLRDIVHNLVKLSFDQEDLMGTFASVKQSDPRFVTLSEEQLQLKDDAKIVEDSLMSLANRVFQIASFVTREVTDMNDHMDKSVEAIKERKKPKAVAEQQFAMTSMNNLALLLDDVLKQMQQAMKDAMGGKPQKGEGQDMKLSELQQQLNQQIEDLKKSGKSGRQLSEELAKLAAQQERIRKALQEMQEKMGPGENGLKPGDGIPKKMEETETDLVNKNITQETINRQKEILTRLLQAEDAMRERELDNERKGETAKDYEKALPQAFEEYFKMKEKEVELLKTVPPKLYPYYKNEVNNYFKRLENGKND